MIRKLLVIRIYLFLPLLILSTSNIYGQWQNSANIVQLNSNNRDKAVIVSDNNEGLAYGKFAVLGNPDDYLNDVLMYVGANDDAFSGSTILKLVANNVTGNPTVLEGFTNSNLSLFKFEYNGNAHIRGKLNVRKSGVSGRILEAHGKEAIWFNGSQYSWGFGGTWNRFADPITIGSNIMPPLGVGLRIDESKKLNLHGGDINIIGNGDFYFKGNMENSIIFEGDNNDTQSEIKSSKSQGFLSMSSIDKIYLRVQNENKIELLAAEDVAHFNTDINLANTQRIQWGSPSNSPDVVISGNANLLKINHELTNGQINMTTKNGDITLINGKTGIFIVDDQIGIGTDNPLHTLHIQGDVGITGEFYALSDRRLKKDIKKIEKVLPIILQLSPMTYLWRDKPDDQKQSIGLIAQEVEKLFPEAVITDMEGIKMVNYRVFSVLSIQAIKEQQKMINNLNERLIAIEKMMD